MSVANSPMVSRLKTLIPLLARLCYAIHRSLAPERVVEVETPASRGLGFLDVRIAQIFQAKVAHLMIQEEVEDGA
jgi:hypothetical protein